MGEPLYVTPDETAPISPPHWIDDPAFEKALADQAVSNAQASRRFAATVMAEHFTESRRVRRRFIRLILRRKASA